MPNSFYDLSAGLPNGSEYAMEDLRGKVVLVVNVASKVSTALFHNLVLLDSCHVLALMTSLYQCSFVGQYNGLEDLYNRYADKGFIILGFPCNQFGMAFHHAF